MSLFLIDFGGKPAVFIHILKTGGTSIRHDRQLSGHRLYTPDLKWLKLPILHSFAFIRDPYTRAQSCYKDFCYARGSTAPNVDFAGWLRHFNRKGAAVDDIRTVDHHAAPQTHPVHGLQHADRVYRFEDGLQAGLDSFADSFGYDHIFLTSHLRDTSSHPTPELTDEVRSLIDEFYAKDFGFIKNM